MAHYPGGKNQSGSYQKIINQIPPHDVYIELFLGSGAILRLKKPAARSMGVEIDPIVFMEWEQHVEYSGIVMLMDALEFIDNWKECIFPEGKRVFVYIDPPYLAETRKSQAKIYRHEFMAPEQHEQLLNKIVDLDWMIAISGYRSRMYDQALKGWRRIDWNVTTRGGSGATESLWMNYPEPFELHDYSFLGDDYRVRERIAKKKRRWDKRLATMPALERYAILDVIEKHRAGTTVDGDVSSSHHQI